METTELTTEQRETALQELGLTYSAEFVPFSKSRNAAEKHLSLNWRVRLVKGTGFGTLVLATDYSQGIGHIPGRSQGRETYEQRVADKQTVETGKLFKAGRYIFPTGKLPIPKFIDVMYSLALDANVLDYATFEDWAADFGYDRDSRKAETIYRKCLEIALKLRAMLGDGGLAKLQEIVSGY